jgi:hypothetical protein
VGSVSETYFAKFPDRLREDRVLRAVLIGMLRKHARYGQWGSVTAATGCPQEPTREGRFRCDGSAPGAFL